MAKSRFKGVRNKIEEFETEIVRRSKVKISPNKIKRKEFLIRSDKKLKTSQGYDKNDKKPQKQMSDCKNVSLEKIKLMHTMFQFEEFDVKENVKHDTKIDYENDILKLGKSFERKNAFQILLKSANGGQTPPMKPRKSKNKKAIGSIGSDQKSIREWLKKDQI